MTYNIPDPKGFQYLEDLSTAYWYSQVFFTALELKLFMHLDQKKTSIQQLSKACTCKPEELHRLLRALEKMELVNHQKSSWSNTLSSSTFLVPDKPDYMGDFFLYRQYMRPSWDMLTQKVSNTQLSKKEDLTYEQKNYMYVKAMDTIVRQKARQIAKIIAPLNLCGAVLDIGGGAGGMARELLTVMPGSHGSLLEIPEVILAAKRLYPDPEKWAHITPISGDFRTHEFNTSFSLIILSNFLHTYSPKEAQDLLIKSINLLEKTGHILIHDYFPDRKGVAPQKGSLYDLSMMLNTYNGACHETGLITQWLNKAGIKNIHITDLDTDTSVILAGPK